MTWGVLVPMIIFAIIKIAVTSLPSGAVNWIMKRFETHTELQEEHTTIMINEKRLEGEAKRRVIQAFNEGDFLKQYQIFPGYEQTYLQPEDGGTPIVIHTKKGNKEIQLFLFRYEDHVDVVKQYKKKIAAYRLRSDSLQQHSMLA